MFEKFFNWYNVVGNEFGVGHNTCNSRSDSEIAVYGNLLDVQKCIMAQIAPHKETVLPGYSGLNISSDVFVCEVSVFSVIPGENSWLKESEELGMEPVDWRVSSIGVEQYKAGFEELTDSGQLEM